ncbi:helix-turn-helix domain-containing protein [Streptomyces avicenniae]|uniref:helix-turn-helix domain-containing protein n=1 Tax=Streptomyces avicenniae TaxID=500153 RepID=UPI00069AEED0|nr:helix-turn-helix transcriptional regulator [Streptomyces avicenniae]
MAEDTNTPEDFKEPPTPQQRFGADLRAVRLGQKLTQKHLATATNYTVSYVSQIESGKFMPSKSFAEGCDTVFRTSGLFASMRDRLGEEDHPQNFMPYVNLERKASSVRSYSGMLIEGLFQTEEYAHAIFRSGHPTVPKETIEAKVAARVGRRKLLTQERPPAVWVVLHEASLHCHVGGREAMGRQLQYLLEWAERPGIDVQILPSSAGSAGIHMLPFSVLDFEQEPTVAYTDDPQGGRVYRRPATVGLCVQSYDRLRANALPLSKSLAFIDTVRRDYAS